MNKIQRLPAKPLFGELAKTEEDSLTTKSVWQKRLLYLLKTPIANEDLNKIADIAELKDKFNVEGMTLGDLIHIQQIIKAANGDTKAYRAISVATEGVSEAVERSDKLIDPLTKMVDMLYSATNKARRDNPGDDGDMDSMFSDNIIEVDITDIDKGDNQEGNV